jgi:hypothetical protein
MSISQADVIKAGYPPRPDPTLAADAYQEWLNLVTASATLIPLHAVATSGVRMGQVQSTNSYFWDGLVIEKVQTSTHYLEAIGAFNIPIFAPYGSISQATIWPGLGGAFENSNPMDIIQDGIEYDSTGNVGTYLIWFEYFPGDPNKTREGFVPALNDSITFYAWECNSSTALAVGGGYGCFFWYDSTQGLAQGTISIQAPNTTFGGTTVEGIIERPDQGSHRPQQDYPLPPWYYAYMTLTAIDSNSVQHSFEAPYENVTLVNGNNQTLATVAQNGSTQETFTWVAPQ